jgi:hypothetical protein
MPLFLDFFLSDVGTSTLYDNMEHHFAWGLQGQCGLEGKLAYLQWRTYDEFCFQDKVSTVDELNHPPPMEIGGAAQREELHGKF